MPILSLLPRPRHTGTYVVAALVLRLVTIPLNHTWDLQTWNNLYADLARDQSPYETMRYMSYAARASRLALYPWYEYYAYPPVAIYIYYPLAKLYTLLAGAPDYTWAGYLSIVVLPADFLLSVLFKAPILIADIGTAWALARLTRPAVGAAYLVNPLTLLAANWTFDAIMVFCITLALWFAERGQFGRAGAMLAIGAATKFLAGLLLPALVIYLLHQRRPIRVVANTVFTFAAILLALCGPFIDGMPFVLRFHAERHGGGMTWQFLLHTASVWFREYEWSWVYLSFSAWLGALTSVLGLIATYSLLVLRPRSLPVTFLMTLLGFFASSKLVNEPYALSLLPLAAVVVHQTAGQVAKRLYSLSWSIPVSFAALNVPLPAFFLSAALSLGLVKSDAIESTYSWYIARVFPFVALALLILAIAFAVVCLVAMVQCARSNASGASRPHQRIAWAR